MKANNNCVSACDIPFTLIPRLIKVSGAEELPSNYADSYVCLDSDNKQELRSKETSL